MPKLSVIVPVYNAESYIKQCVTSIMTQSYKDFELILVDDGSTDSSPIICDEFATQYDNIRIIHIDNGGASKARNVGIAEAIGEFVWFIDADDWIEKDFLISLNWDAMPDILFFGFIKQSNTEKVINRIRPEFKDYVNKKEIGHILNELFISKELYFGFTWNKIFSKKIIDTNNLHFRENLIIKEDEVFTLEFCRYISSLGIASETPYNYRFLENSLSHSVRGNKNMFQLASFLDKEIEWTAYPEELSSSFKLSILNYYFAALREQKDSGSLNNGMIDSYLAYYRRNKEIIKKSKKRRYYP